MHHARTCPMPGMQDEPIAGDQHAAEVVAEGAMRQQPVPPTDEAPFGRVAQTYDRLAPFYDWIQAPLEFPGGRKRRVRILRGAVGDVLEIGIGTGRDLGLYPKAVRLTAIDVSERMIERTRLRAARLNRSVDVRLAGAECLPFEASTFDTVIGMCVLSSVSDLGRVLQEVARVLKPGGQLRLLEHVRPRGRWLGVLADSVTPIVRRLLGADLNRDIEAALGEEGFEILRVREGGVWREVVARPPSRDVG